MPRNSAHRPLAAKAPRGLGRPTAATQAPPASAARAPQRAKGCETTASGSRPSVAGKTLITKPRAGKLASKAPGNALKAAEKAAHAAALAAERSALEKTIADIVARVQSEVDTIERDIATREEAYIKSTWAHGNVLRGWHGLGRALHSSETLLTGNGSGVRSGVPRPRKSRRSDRIFSLSSSTSPFTLDNPHVQIVKRGVVKKKKKKKTKKK